MDEIRDIALRRRLQAQLAVRGHRIVHEYNGVRQFAVVQNLCLCVFWLRALLFLFFVVDGGDIGIVVVYSIPDRMLRNVPVIWHG